MIATSERGSPDRSIRHEQELFRLRNRLVRRVPVLTGGQRLSCSSRESGSAVLWCKSSVVLPASLVALPIVATPQHWGDERITCASEQMAQRPKSPLVPYPRGEWPSRIALPGSQQTR